MIKKKKQSKKTQNGLIIMCSTVTDSRVHVGDNELRAAAVFLARKQRRYQPAGAGDQAAQARNLPPRAVLAHDPLLGLRPQRETQVHGAGAQDQVPQNSSSPGQTNGRLSDIMSNGFVFDRVPFEMIVFPLPVMSRRWRRSRKWRESGTERAPPNSLSPSSTLASLLPRWEERFSCFRLTLVHVLKGFVTFARSLRG